MKTKQRKFVWLCVIVICILLSAFVAIKWNSIFQRGNPVPYLAAAVKLSDDHTFEAVAGMEGIYITKRGDQEDLFRMIQDVYAVEYKDQLGSGYLFSDSEKNYTVGSEIYWGRFTVWTLSFDDGFPR